MLRCIAFCGLTPRLPLSRDQGLNSHTHIQLSPWSKVIDTEWVICLDFRKICFCVMSINPTNNCPEEMEEDGNFHMHHLVCRLYLFLSVLSMWKPERIRAYFLKNKLLTEISKINFLDQVESSKILESWNIFIFNMKHPPNPKYWTPHIRILC